MCFAIIIKKNLIMLKKNLKDTIKLDGSLGGNQSQLYVICTNRFVCFFVMGKVMSLMHVYLKN